jgi:isopropylmalate/homocitrate/citramalate synthase
MSVKGGKRYMRPAGLVIDTTAIALRQEPADGLTRFIGFVLETGAAAAEVWGMQFRSLTAPIPARRLLVRVKDVTEYIACKRLGAVEFVTDARSFADRFGEGTFPDLTVEVSLVSAAGFYQVDFADFTVLRERAGAMRVSGLCDVMAYDYKACFSRVQKIFGPGVSVRFSNGAFCATAAAYEWLKAGGTAVCSAFAGAGETAFLEELLAALNVMGNGGYRLDGMPRLRAAYEEIARTQIVNFKPVAGKNIFDFESGIHADGIFKNPINYEPFSPESVGGHRRLVIGKYSGREAIRMKLFELGIPINDVSLARVNEAVRTKAIEKRRSLWDEEVRQIYLDLYAERGNGA